MADHKAEVDEEGRYRPVEINLKNPVVAGVLAWLWPGAGHVYQGRYGKAALFMICILVTYFWGLAMGDGHVVYASFRQHDMRFHYLPQVCVGLPALPAVAQSLSVKNDGKPLFGIDVMAPPPLPIHEQKHDQKAVWFEKLTYLFEMGTLYTMVAGLMNLLVIYDAAAGPVFAAPGQPSGAPPGDEQAQSEAAGGFEFLAIIIGLMGGLALRTHFGFAGLLPSYGFAIAGGLIGLAFSRLLFGALGALFGARSVVDNDLISSSDSSNDGGDAAQESQS